MEQIGEVAARIVVSAGQARRGIEVHPVTDRASWLAWRRRDVTASVAGALLGCHEYMSPLKLWAEKSGAIQPSEEMTEAMERGIELEPLALRWLAKKRPDWTNVHNPQIYLRDPEYRLGATPDAYATDPKRGPGVIQFKSVEPSVFRRKWKTESGEIEPPLWIAVQALIEAELSGFKWAAVAPLVISHGIELEIIDIPLHPKLMDRVRAESSSFWRMIEEGRKPEPDWAQDGRLIEQFYEPNGEVIDLSSDNSLPALCDEKDQLSSDKSSADKRLKEIKAELLSKLDNASAARIADGRLITAKEVHRKGYEVKPSSYVDVRVKAAIANN